MVCLKLPNHIKCSNVLLEKMSKYVTFLIANVTVSLFLYFWKHIPKLQNYLEDVSFAIAGENVKFDNHGDSVPYYDLISWQRHTSGDIQFVKVGLYDGAQHSGRELMIEEQAIMWSNLHNKARSWLCNAVPSVDLIIQLTL